MTAVVVKRKGSDSNEGASTSKQRKLEESTKVSQKSVDHAVINFIVQGLHPFGIVEQAGFRSLVQQLQPNSTVISRSTVRTMIEKNTAEMKANVRKAMQNIKYIATTTDSWTSHRQSFVGVTAHWIDPESLERSSVALACRRLKGPHTFDALAGLLNDIHTEFNIREKIVRTTTDNGSNFVKAFRVYGPDENNSLDTSSLGSLAEGHQVVEANENEEDDALGVEVEAVEIGSLLDEEDDSSEYQLPKHHRCACHVLNLISTVDATKANSNETYKKLSRASFAKCGGLWNKSARSTIAAEVIERECKLQLIRPNDTRWNSLFLAVERILRIIKDNGEGAIRAVCIALKVPMLNPAELAFLTEYVSTMRPVVKALNIMQAEADVHMGWLVPTISLLSVKLDRLRISAKFCQPLIDALQGGIQQRFGPMLADPELIAAAILLPKFRTSWTSNDDMLKMGLDYIKTNLDQEPVQLVRNNSSSSDEEDYFRVIKSNIQETTRQLDAYLASTSDTMDILKSVPAVFNLSLKVNTPLPASAACERLFSIAGQIFSPKRARLDSKNFENQLLLKLNKKFLP
ncbi:uncharacterized protein LOC122829491 [Gambusia affinis]|nr:uncharacterized protein LOC122829491 [Gambusia affinis]